MRKCCKNDDCKDGIGLKILAENFHKAKNLSGYSYMCKVCATENTYFDPTIDPKTTKKVCNDKNCDEPEKFLTEFTKQKQGNIVVMLINAVYVDKKKDDQNEIRILTKKELKFAMEAYATEKYCKKLILISLHTQATDFKQFAKNAINKKMVNVNHDLNHL